MALSKGSLASKVLGIGPEGGGLKKLAIWYKSGRLTAPPIEALFNPEQIKVSRSVNWQTKKAVAPGQFKKAGGAQEDTPVQQRFLSVAPASLGVTLFFDTYEPHHDHWSLGQIATSFAVPTNPFQSPTATDVSEYTSKLAALAKVQPESHEPPKCTLQWGRWGGQTKLFEGVLKDITITYTMFMPNGMPVRATAECTFIEAMTEAEYRRGELHSADVAKSRIIRRHDTLHSLAAEEYNDPRLWRHIARANHIVNPRTLKPGDVLIIPPLPT